MSIGKSSLARAAVVANTAPAPAPASIHDEPEAPRYVCVTVPVVRIAADPAVTATDALCRSVQKRGILSPILLAQTAPDAYRVLDGERRLAAAIACGLTAVPAVTVAMTAAEAGAARREIQRFDAPAATPAIPSAPEIADRHITTVGQSMPAWLL